MKLIITEKPSVAKDIAKVLNISERKNGYMLGSGYYITWAFGHLIELCQPDEYDDSLKEWHMEALPIIPQSFKTKIIERSADQFAVIKSLCQLEELTQVICATDAGREGELIFRMIYELAQCKAPISRLWISSQTDSAIKEGFEKLKSGDDYRFLYDSAKSRSEADWLVGINATRAYSIKFSRGHGVLSVGRVQTPVLKLIVDRYRLHHGFNSQSFYEIWATIDHSNGSFLAVYTRDKESRFDQQETAESIQKEISQIPKGQIKELIQKQVFEKQPLLYDLTELQKDANRQFKYSADDTLKHMQALYETHKILSYPRTSSRYLSSDIAPKIPLLLNSISDLATFQSMIQQIKSKSAQMAARMINDKQVTDHHAIIPTDKRPNMSLLSEPERNIYELVIRRFLAAFLPECEKRHTDVTVAFGAHDFKATGMIIKTIGWRQLYPETSQNSVELPMMAQADPVTYRKLDVKKGQTKAAPLYTEASILAAMETAGKDIEDDELRQAMKHCGLGTPATRAQILEKLIQINYIIRDKTKLLPTPKGEYIIDCIQDSIMGSAELTGEWERKLNLMAQGEIKRLDFMQEIAYFTRSIVSLVATNARYALRADQVIFGNCPACQKGKIIDMKKSYACTEWKSSGCEFVIWKQMAQKTITESMVKTLFKNGKTAVIKGFKNKSGNPFNARLLIQERKVVMDFEQESLGACPCCEGDMIETAKAYSCSKWKETGCSAVIWKEIAKRKITKAEAKVLIQKGQTELLEGFKSREGKAFSIGLKFQEGKVVFYTPEVNKS